jgi:hypothetical protein
MRKDEQGQQVPGGIETFTIEDVRCACAVCGAHVMAWQGHELSGWCSVCGSYELRALTDVPAASRNAPCIGHAA